VPLVAAQSYQLCSGYTEGSSHALHNMRIITSVTKGILHNTRKPTSMLEGIAMGPVMEFVNVNHKKTKGEI
jgi:hypothetical protein